MKWLDRIPVIALFISVIFLSFCSKGDLKEAQTRGEDSLSQEQIIVSNLLEIKAPEKPTIVKTRKPKQKSDPPETSNFTENESNLKVQLLDSSWITFNNSLGENEGFKKHSFVGNPTDHIALIRTKYYEGGGYIVLDLRSGLFLDVFTFPQISPDEKWVAEVGYQDVEQEVRPGFRIWEITGHSFELGFDYSGIDASDVSWVSTEAVDVCLSISPFKDCIRHRFILHNGVWRSNQDLNSQIEPDSSISLYDFSEETDIEWNYGIEYQLSEQFKSYLSQDIAYNRGIIYGIDQEKILGYDVGTAERLSINIPIKANPGISLSAMGKYLWVDQLLVDIEGGAFNSITAQKFLPSPIMGDVVWDDKEIWITSGTPKIGKYSREPSSIDFSVFDRKSGKLIRRLNIQSVYEKLILGSESIIVWGNRKVHQFERQNGTELMNISIPNKWIYDVAVGNDGFYFLADGTIIVMSDNGEVLAQYDSPVLKYPQRILVNKWDDLIVLGDRILYHLEENKWIPVLDIRSGGRKSQIKDLVFADDNQYLWVLTNEGLTGIDLATKE